MPNKKYNDSNNLMDANFVISPLDDNDWIAESILPDLSEIKLPKTLDLRKDLHTVVNQGIYPTCAAHVARCIKEYQEKKDIGMTEKFSHWYVYDNRKNYPTKGMYGRNVMEILQEKGCCIKSDYKSSNKKGTPENVDKLANNYKIKSYAKVTTIEGVKKTLFLNGPCYVSFNIYNKGTSFWKPKQNGDKIIGGHAVAIVGYDKNGFILRNSWGIFWGRGGYTNFPYSDFGMQGEIWSSIDEKSVKPKPKNKCNCFK